MRAALTKLFADAPPYPITSHHRQPTFLLARVEKMACLDLLRSSSTPVRPGRPRQAAGVFTVRFAGQGAGGIPLNLPAEFVTPTKHCDSN